jgi:hypothetical protein
MGKDADYKRLSMKPDSAASARRAASALFVGNGFAFGVWSAHISVFKQNYQLSNAQLTIPLFTLAVRRRGAGREVWGQRLQPPPASVIWASWLGRRWRELFPECSACA